MRTVWGNIPLTAHHDQLNRARHLRRRQADPWLIQHRLKQIVDESLHGFRANVARIDRGRKLAQDGITELCNRENPDAPYRLVLLLRDEQAMK